MKSNYQQLRSRGFIEDQDLQNFIDLDENALKAMLKSEIPFERTISARLIAKYNNQEVLETLIECILIEKKLYCKIALSESISEFGEDAAKLLVNHLGKVGSNQHHKLPDKPFLKNNYPLPRDIIARTICKIGLPALSSLKKCLTDGSYEQKLEAIDAIGFVSYYSNDSSSKNAIITIMNLHLEDNLILWKSIRALQSFDDEEVIFILNKYINSDIPQISWEAERSIRQIKRKQ